MVGRGPGTADPSAGLYRLDGELSEPMPDEQAGPLAAPSAAAERWLVLADDRGVGAALAASLEGAGAQCHLVGHGMAGAARPPERGGGPGASGAGAGEVVLHRASTS